MISRIRVRSLAGALLLAAACGGGAAPESDSDDDPTTEETPEPAAPPAEMTSDDAGVAESESDCSDFSGRVTYENTIRSIVRERCVKCHAGSYETRNSDGESRLYSIVPQASDSDWVRDWDSFSTMASTACELIAEGTMPPSQSEERMSDTELAAFATFCADLESAGADAVVGSIVPSVTVTMDDEEWTPQTTAGATVLVVPLTVTTVDEDDEELHLRIGIDNDRSGFDGTTLISCEEVAANSTFTEILDAEHGLTDSLEERRHNLYVCVSDGDSVYCDYADGRLEVAPNRDGDGDGVYLADGDCDDGSSSIGAEGTLFYLDLDEDSYGDEDTGSRRCGASTGRVEDHTDCNDACADCYPNSTETCDLMDNDCDGSSDEGLEATTYYLDTDGDGYSGTTEGEYCVPPEGATETEGADCDDSNAGVYPSAEESRDTSGCSDGVDNDCDLAIDSEDPGCLPPETCDGEDNDEDGTTDEGCSFATYIAPLVAMKCTSSSCHGGRSPRQGLDLREDQYDQLVNVPANTSSQGWDRVEPSSSATSYLYYQITIRSMGGLSAEERELIRIWIDAGAPNN